MALTTSSSCRAGQVLRHPSSARKPAISLRNPISGHPPGTEARVRGASTRSFRSAKAAPPPGWPPLLPPSAWTPPSSRPSRRARRRARNAMAHYRPWLEGRACLPVSRFPARTVARTLSEPRGGCRDHRGRQSYLHSRALLPANWPCCRRASRSPKARMSTSRSIAAGKHGGPDRLRHGPCQSLRGPRAWRPSGRSNSPSRRSRATSRPVTLPNSSPGAAPASHPVGESAHSRRSGHEAVRCGPTRDRPMSAPCGSPPRWRACIMCCTPPRATPMRICSSP